MPMNQEQKQADTSAHSLTSQKISPEGLGGWLVLVMISLFLSAIKNISSLIVLKQALEFPMWGIVSEKLYSWTIVETVFTLSMLSLNIFLLVLFFNRKKLFPKLFIVTSVVSVAFAKLDVLIVERIIPSADVNAVPFWSTMFWSIVLIVYISVSRRVKATFVR